MDNKIFNILLLTPIFFRQLNKFSSIWKRIRCCNDVMNHIDCVMKRDVYPQKMYSCSKNIRGISDFVLKISVVYQKEYIMGDIAWIFT